MNLQDLSLGGLLGTLLTALGFKARMDRVDTRIDLLETKMLTRPEFIIYTSAANDRHKSIEKQLECLIEKQDRILDRLLD